MDEHAGIEPTLPNFFISWENERDRNDAFWNVYVVIATAISNTQTSTDQHQNLNFYWLI